MEAFKIISNYFQIAPPAFGLDISDTSLKFAQLKREGDHFKLHTYGERDLEAGIIEAGIIKKPKALADILKKTLSKEKLPPYIVASLPGEIVFLNAIQLPDLGQEEISSAVEVESETHIPISLSEAYSDYHVLPIDIDSGSYILSVAARKKVVNSYLRMFAKAGLSILAIEPESSAIARSVIGGSFSKKPILIVEIGANRTRLLVFVADSVVFIGSSQFSASLGAREIAKKFKLEPTEAHQLQWELGFSGEGRDGKKVQAILTPFIYRLHEDISKYVDFFDKKTVRDKLPFGPIGSIILSGGGSRMPGLDDYLSTKLSLPIVKANPWINILSKKRKKKGRSVKKPLREEQSLRYAASLGLALRAVDSNIREIFDKKL